MSRFSIGVSVRREDRLRARNAVALRPLQRFLRFPLRPLPSLFVCGRVGVRINHRRGTNSGLTVQGAHPRDMESDAVRSNLSDREIVAARNRVAWLFDDLSRENRGISPAVGALAHEE